MLKLFKSAVCLGLLVITMSATAQAMTRADAVEWLMQNGDSGTDGRVFVNIAYGITDIIGEENTHAFNLCVYEVIRRMKYQLPKNIDLNEVVRVAREIIAYEDEVRLRPGR